MIKNTRADENANSAEVSPVLADRLKESKKHASEGFWKELGASIPKIAVILVGLVVAALFATKQNVVYVVPPENSPRDPSKDVSSADVSDQLPGKRSEPPYKAIDSDPAVPHLPRETSKKETPPQSPEEKIPRAIEAEEAVLNPGYTSIEITSIEGVNAERWKSKLEKKVASELGNGAKQAARKNDFPRIEIIAVFKEEVRDAIRPPNYVPTLAVSSFYFGSDGTLKTSQDKHYVGALAKTPAQEADWDELIKAAAIDIKK